jgi:HTH-type transcriptional regulator/antitoxin HigA
MDIRPIKTLEDHAWGLREIEHGMSSGVEPGTAEGNRLEVIMILVEAYEKAHHSIPPTDPIDAIKFRMEQQQLTTADLSTVFGTRGRASEILQRKRRMSLDMVRALHKHLGIPLEVLAREYKLKSTRAKKAAKKANRKAA